MTAGRHLARSFVRSPRRDRQRGLSSHRNGSTRHPPPQTGPYQHHIWDRPSRSGYHQRMSREQYRHRGHPSPGCKHSHIRHIGTVSLYSLPLRQHHTVYRQLSCDSIICRQGTGEELYDSQRLIKPTTCSPSQSGESGGGDKGRHGIDSIAVPAGWV